jgi:hypothetical protein
VKELDKQNINIDKEFQSDFDKEIKKYLPKNNDIRGDRS